MANNCVTNFHIVAKKKEPLQEIADIFNSLREKFPKEPLESNWWGQTWLGNLATVLGYDISTFQGEMRGFVDPEFYLYPCLCMSANDVTDKPFEVYGQEDNYAISFSVLSGWALPDWVLSWLNGLAEKHSAEAMIVSFRSTDEFHNFNNCQNPEVIGDIYEIDHEDGGTYDIGQETEFLQNISKITGIEITEAMKKDADKHNFKKIKALVEEWNDNHEDEECYIHIYQEQ